MHHLKSASRRALLVAIAAGTTVPAFAQSKSTFPSKPIKLVVAFAPGGPNDVMARVLAQQLSTGLGKPVIVENKAGAGGVIGSDSVAKAPADGHTLLFASAPFVMAPAIQAKLPFDTLKDFVAVTKVAESPMVLMVPANSPFKTANELVEHARKNPGKLNYGTGGVGSTPHLTTELLGVVTNTKFSHVPYKGGGESIKALMGGEIDLLIDSITSTGAALSSGRVRALAVTQSKRAAKLPNVPTFEEAGIKKFAMTHWVGLVAPANVPDDVLTKLRIETVKAIRSPEVESRLAELGAQPVGDTSTQFQDFLKAELAQWRQVAKSANITAQ